MEHLTWYLEAGLELPSVPIVHRMVADTDVVFRVKDGRLNDGLCGGDAVHMNIFNLKQTTLKFIATYSIVR